MISLWCLSAVLQALWCCSSKSHHCPFFSSASRHPKYISFPNSTPSQVKHKPVSCAATSEIWDTRHPLFSSLPRMKPPGAPGPDRRATPVSAGSLVPNHASSTNTPSQGRGTSHADSPQKAGTSGEPSTPLSPLPTVMGKQLGLSFASRGRGGCR